ncbi:PadR family transcriptional regulator [Bdellovibrio sp. HCB2-146]|uniref:PadR family transcriptional regulator n=1 Tax=Bdellovibrio sp. HCB2-146 TaxID=3394362 RepID=UPI0039BD0C7A
MNPQFKKGVLELCVLTMISRKDYYGYELVEEISKVLEISEGTLYPILRRLTEEGYFETYLRESTEGPPRKYYRITKGGKDFQKSQLKQWNEFNQQIETLIGKGSHEQARLLKST